jgi:hypothetical protein
MARKISARTAEYRRQYFEEHREQIRANVRANYYNNPEVRQNKLDKQKQRVYVEGTIRFVRRLFV